MDSKFINNATDLKIWQDNYMYKSKLIQQDFKKELTPFLTDKIIFKPNIFDLEIWYNVFDYNEMEENRHEFIKKLYSFNFIVLTETKQILITVLTEEK
jgi:hypothetical protein